MLEKVFKSDIKVRNDLEFLHELAEFHESVDGAHIELDGLSQLLVELDGGGTVEDDLHLLTQFVHVRLTETKLFLCNVPSDDLHSRQSPSLGLLQLVKYLGRHELLQPHFCLHPSLYQDIITNVYKD